MEEYNTSMICNRWVIESYDLLNIDDEESTVVIFTKDENTWMRSPCAEFGGHE